MRLEIKVHPKASREELVEKDGVLRAYVSAAPEKGKANKSVIELVAERYKVPKSRVRIVSGEKSRNKILEVI
jgi:uncharacterized protein (TIGR00251 family)